MNEKRAIRMFTAVVVKILLRDTLSEVDARIMDYLDGLQILYEKEEHPDLGFRYLLYAEGRDLAEGIVQVQPHGMDQLFVLIQRVFFSSDSEQERYDRFLRLRGMLQSFVLENVLPESNPGRVLEYENGFSQMPLSPEERARIEERQAQRRESRLQQGFKKQFPLDSTFETTLDAVRRLIDQYIKRQKEFDNHFWNLIGSDLWSENKVEWVKELSIRGRGHFADLGKITLIQVNDRLCKITIENTWEAIPFVEQGDADALYFETTRELEVLAAYLRNSFSTHGSTLSAIPELPQDVQNANAPASSSDVSQIHEKDLPWEKIPNSNSDQKMVYLWWQGLTYLEIGRQTHLSSKRIANRLSELRKEFGDKVVPYDNERRSRHIP